MDLKSAIKNFVIYIFSVAITLVLAAIFEYYFSSYSGSRLLLMNFALIIISILFFSAIKKYFSLWADKYFFAHIYDDKEIISQLSGKLRTTLEINKTYDNIYNVLSAAFGFKDFSLYAFNEKQNLYILKYNQGFNTSYNKKDLINDLFAIKAGAKQDVIVLTEMNKNSKSKPVHDALDRLIKLKIGVIVFLNIKNSIDILIFGQKQNLDRYYENEVRMMSVACSQAAIALENAHLYEEMKNFNITLEHEVKRATSDLRAANKKLTRLDEAKSEFVSMASHQLRTPLTIIKGYISMLLEGNFGDLDATLKDPLEKVYESNERLIRMVENMLNVSRIEAGRMSLIRKELNIEYLVCDVVDEVKGSAEKKGLNMVYTSPKKMLPKISIDEEKIRQVIINLLDNAVKYTKKGQINISIDREGDNIKFCVTDMGIGLKEEELNNLLFKKFARGRNGISVNTEGTGLGLYIARQMIEMHGGKIWAESQGDGKGSSFYFLLPILKSLDQSNIISKK